MNEAVAQFLVARIIDCANYALTEAKENEGDAFYKGRKLAYYEVLSLLQNELDLHDENLKEYGLDINLEKTLFLE
jgi:hypothetical protein